MSVEPHGAAELGGGERRAPTWPDARVRRQLLAVREALRLRRLAQDLCLQQRLYDEHCLFELAKEARRDLMQSLRAARAFWRLALGLQP